MQTLSAPTDKRELICSKLFIPPPTVSGTKLKRENCSTSFTLIMLLFILPLTSNIINSSTSLILYIFT